MSHAVEMRNRALSMRLRTVKSYGVGNSEISQILGLGLLPARTSSSRRRSVLLRSSPPSPRLGAALMRLAKPATARAGRALPRG